MMERYCLDIAGFPILIEGESSVALIRDMNGMSSFRLLKESSSDDFRILFDTSIVGPDYGSEVGTRISVEAGLSCRFYSDDLQCFLRAMDGDDSVLLQYMFGSRCVKVSVCCSSVLIRYALWNAISMLLCQEKMIFIHASCIVHQDRGVLFLGESGTGKSTHSRLWLENVKDTFLLNDDCPALLIDPKGRVRVFGSPWSGKTPCFRNHSVEVSAIVRLYQASSNTINKLSEFESFGALYPSFSPILRLHRIFSDSVNMILEQVAKRVPVYHLGCLPNVEAAQLVHTTLDCSQI